MGTAHRAVCLLVRFFAPSSHTTPTRASDEFARKFALKSARRTYEFEKEIEKFRTVLNDQRIVLLELDAYSKNTAKVSDRDIKKGFVDYADDGR